MFIIQLIYNLSILVAASVISNFIDVRWNKNSVSGKVLQGILFGFISILAMQYPFVLTRGIIFDGRSVVLSICALFFGPASGFIAGIMAILMRISIGGAGALMGVSVISSSVLIGLIFNRLIKENKITLNNFTLYLLGLIVHTIMILMMSLLPSSYTVHALKTIGITVIIFYPVATVLIGKILLDHEINLKTNKELKESEERFRLLFENSADGIILGSPDGSIYAANKAACNILQRSEEEICLLGRDKIVDMTDPNLKKLFEERSKYGKAEGELHIIRKDGTRILVEGSSTLFTDKNGKLKTSLIFRDITEKKKADEEIRKLNRLYAVLSDINQMIVRTKDIQKIYDETCRIAVEIGKFKFAWIGAVDNKNQKVVPVAFFGPDKSYLDNLNIDLTDEIRSSGPTGKAVKFKKYFIANNIEQDSQMKPWRDAAMQYQYKSSASFPIITDNGVIATLNLYSEESFFFDEQEIKLLDELTKDISFAIQSIENDKQRQLAEEKIRENERFLSTLIDNLPGFIYRCANDRDWTMLYITKQCEDVTGYKPDEFINNRALAFNDIIHPDYRELLWNKWQEILKQKKYFEYEYPIITKSDNIKWVWERGRGVFNDNGELQYLEGFITDITKRVQLETELKENEEKMRLLVEGTSYFFFYTHDLEGRITYISPSVEKITGHKVEEWLNQNHWFLTDSPINELARENTRKMLRGEQAEYPVYVEIYNAKNEKLLLEVFEVTHYKEGKIIGLHGVARDVTAQKHAEEEIRKLYYAIEKSPVSIFITNINGEIEYANEKFFQITGYSKEELIGKHISIIRSGYHDDEFIKNLWNTILQGNEWRGEILNKKKNGETYWNLVHISPLTDKNGKITHFISIHEDITDKKKAEELLEKSVIRLNRAEIASKSGNWELNLETRKIVGSKGAQLIYGVEGEEFDYEIIKKVPLPEYRKMLDDALKNLIENNIPYDVEFKIKKVDTGEIRDIHSVALYDKERKTVLGIIQDITEKKKMLEELIKAKERAEISEKIKTNFLAQMSHEIRTPINIIMGNMSLIKEVVCGEKRSEICDLFDSIELANKRIMRTIDLILNMSELQTKSYEPIFREIDLETDVLKNLIDEYKLMAEKKKLELIFINKLKKSRIKADEYSVTQIFANLIDNALKYTKEGKVEIILNENEQKEIYVEVKDTGIGMSDEYMENLFKPFNQEEQGYSRTYDGTGLGLALVKSYCDLNNAKIDVESKKGIGTTFRVTFQNIN